MLHSVMVYPNNSEFFMSPSMLDDSVSKLMNTEQQIENYLTSASTSPVQDFIMPSTSYHLQQQSQDQRQHQLQFPIVNAMRSMAAQNAPLSPPYPIKTEEVQSQHNVECIMFSHNFDLTAPSTASGSSQEQHHILPSQHSPQQQQQQQRMMPYTDVTLIQQRQHHQQQQQHHQQQLRLQHQQQQQFQQQQMLYSSAAPHHSTVTSMATISSATANASVFVPSSVTTSAPFFHPTALAQEDSFQPQATYTPAAHPAAPKRKREESGQLIACQTSPRLSIDSNSTAIESLAPSRRATSSAAVVSTSSRLDKVKTSRSTRITKSTPSSASSSSTEMITSTATTSENKAATTRATAKKATVTTKKTASPSRESSQQPENNEMTSTITHLSTSTGNITHPRRAAQNRAAQRTFRNRRKAYIKTLEQKVQEIDDTRKLMEDVQLENQEIWRRFQIIQNLANRSGLRLPTFTPMEPFAAMTAANEAHQLAQQQQAANGHFGMGSSNDEAEDDGEMSDSFSAKY
ncbi:hypothetical protein BG011_007317 [Mortierella polycephala]|uniref:BZIP domain-containing protein n=1 Tax=Mortierella polycephala TaxID=41804 RepID=A0A9P6U7P5_9FUNG|nr:hypothetical protein BG011_007317 [Mortierella polycephala]